MKFLNDEDMASLIAFCDQRDDLDAGGYTLSKEIMKRLAELGVVNKLGFGRYEITSFGDYLVLKEFDQNTVLPLKTVEEYNI